LRVLSTDQKGAVAELAIAHAALKLGIGVAKPFGDERYDLIFDFHPELVRVQCKWASRVGEILVVRCYSARRTASGLRRRVYTADEVDAFAAYCADVGRCYFLPFELVPSSGSIHLRLTAARNNRRLRVNWASQFEFAARLAGHRGAVAQLGERLAGSQ
jgi:hypothetical protein